MAIAGRGGERGETVMFVIYTTHKFHHSTAFA